MTRRSMVSLFLASTMLCGFAAAASAEDLVTADLVGKADAPNTLVFRTNPDFTQTSPTPTQAEGFKKLFQAFAEKHPDWQIQFQYFTPDIGGEHARMLEQAKALGKPLIVVAMNGSPLNFSWAKDNASALLEASCSARIFIACPR